MSVASFRSSCSAWHTAASAAFALASWLVTASPVVAQDAGGATTVAPDATSPTPSPRAVPSFAGLFQPGPMPRLRLGGARVAAFDRSEAGTEPSGRDCPGCPKRRPFAAVLQTLGINLAFNWVNRTRNPNDEFMVTFHSWWENLRYGFEWDYNSFSINQFGHPYQGNLYFNAGRANGLNFWESAPLAALGSATWEYFGERNHASINDFVTTTMGGIALGEMFHRAGWLVRDATATGKERRRGELLAMLLDPITGANRFLNGDSHRVSENPPDLKPQIKTGDFELGAQFNGEVNHRAVDAAGKPFLGIRLGYNDIYSSPYRVPFDAFNVTLRMGGGAGISEATVRARLYGRYFGEKEHHTEFFVAQAYDYEANGIFDFGGQSVVAGLSRLFPLSRTVSLAAFGVGGPIVLGAITSPVLDPHATPTESEGGEVIERTYDFGPGLEVGAGGILRINGFPVARASYSSFYLRSVSSIEGTTGQHYAQYLRLDLLVPLWRQIRLGVSGDYINRATYYKDLPDVHQWIPQVRFYLAKVSK